MSFRGLVFGTRVDVYRYLELCVLAYARALYDLGRTFVSIDTVPYDVIIYYYYFVFINMT